MVATTAITRILTKADPTKLVKHPVSLKIYGEKSDDGFDESIRLRGVDEPIVVAADGKTIISGVRRRNAAIKAGLDLVPVIERRDLTDDLDIREAIVEANRHNEQTMEAKARAYAELKEVESERAKRRQQATQNSPTHSVRGKVPTPKLCEKPKENGRSKDKAAEQVGVSRKTADKALAVVAKIDEAEATGDKETAAELRETLEVSVSAAHKKAITPKQSESTASIVHDECGRPVIDELREHQGMRAFLLATGNALDKTRRAVKDSADAHGGEWLEASHIDGLLRDAKRAIQKAAFYCECPTCQRDFKADCKRCEGTGYIPERAFGVLSDAEKGWLGV